MEWRCADACEPAIGANSDPDCQDTVSDRIQGLDMGADDYMVKPFNLDELFSAYSCPVAPSSTESAQVLRFADLSWILARARLHVAIELFP